MDTLMGKSIPLRLGFVGTISRSQHDINVGKSIRSSLDDEQKFFREHSVYNSLQDLCGTANLAAKCNRVKFRGKFESLTGVDIGRTHLQGPPFTEATSEIEDQGQAGGITIVRNGYNSREGKPRLDVVTPSRKIL